jgi:UDP-N-acetylmuramyl pentapeptide synthase
MFVNDQIVRRVFHKATGVKNVPLTFHTITSNAKAKQPRGLFLPLWGNFDDLMEAINNGAIAAVWEEGRHVPPYTPNHFPLFFSQNLWDDVKLLLEQYIGFLKQEKHVKEMSNLFDIEFLKEKMATYDNPDKIRSILELMQTLEDMRRG